MKLITNMILFAAITIIHSTQSFAFVERIQCPMSVVKMDSREETIKYLKKNKVLILNESEISDNELLEFLSSFNRFPRKLYNLLAQAGGKVTLIHGEGVTEDPTWPKEEIRTVEGLRFWTQVPGAGGYPPDGVPTRIVVNKLSESGSVDLFLHEHGHTLDSIYGEDSFSGSKEWLKAVRETEGLKEFLNVWTPDGYNSTYPKETFAELFAQYYSCDSTREQIEREIPRMAEYFRKLDSLTDLKNFLVK